MGTIVCYCYEEWRVYAVSVIRIFYSQSPQDSFEYTEYLIDLLGVCSHYGQWSEVLGLFFSSPHGFSEWGCALQNQCNHCVVIRLLLISNSSKEKCIELFRGEFYALHSLIMIMKTLTQ